MMTAVVAVVLELTRLAMLLNSAVAADDEEVAALDRYSGLV